MAVVALIGTVLPGGLEAQSEDPGEFEVRAGSHELIDGVYHVNALLRLRLPSDADVALHSRVPLTIRFEAEFLNRLWFWWDTPEYQVSQRSQLVFYSLTDRYVVRNINSGETASFVTLNEAMDFIGRIDRLPVVDASLLDEDRRYDIRIRAVLDPIELPGALRFFAFWRRDWSLESDWLQWRLDDD